MKNQETSSPVDYSEGVGSALSSYIRQLENYPPLTWSEEEVRTRELDVLRFPLHLLLWLAGTDYLAKGYSELIPKKYSQYLPKAQGDSHPDPLELMTQYEALNRVSAPWKVQAVEQTDFLASKLGRKPAAASKPKKHVGDAPLPMIKLSRQTVVAAGTARAALNQRIYGVLTAADVVDLTHELQPTAAAYLRRRNEFMMYNGRLVISTAGKFGKANHSILMDLVQEGNKGLLRAIDRFSYVHGMGLKFSTYATCWVRQSISRYLTENSKTIRVPSHIIDLRNKITRYKEKCLLGPWAFDEIPHEPSLAKIAEEFKITVKKVTDVMELNPTTTSMNAPLGDETGSAELADQIADPNAAAPEVQASMLYARTQLNAVLGTITKREADVLSRRFGLKDGKTHTLEEVGRILKVTRERVRQIEAKAIKNMRHPQRLKSLVGELVLPNSSALQQR